MSFLPDDFVVPPPLRHRCFRLAPLGLEHNDADFLAWTSSVDHIRATPGFAGRSWPRPMSLEENARDIRLHAADFAARRGFTYTVLGTADDVIGCVYIYPDEDGEADADVRSWVRQDRGELDAELFIAVSVWLGDQWPFERVRYASRPVEGQ